VLVAAAVFAVVATIARAVPGALITDRVDR
jgi:hypothetical protein